MRFFHILLTIIGVGFLQALAFPVLSDEQAAYIDAHAVRIILMPADDDTLTADGDAALAALDALGAERASINWLRLQDMFDPPQIVSDGHSASAHLSAALVFVAPGRVFFDMMAERLRTQAIPFGMIVDSQTAESVPAPFADHVVGLSIAGNGCTRDREKTWIRALAGYQDLYGGRPNWIDRGSDQRCADDAAWLARFGIGGGLGPLQGVASAQDDRTRLPVLRLHDYAQTKGFLETVLRSYPLTLAGIEDRPAFTGLTFQDRALSVRCVAQSLDGRDAPLALTAPSAGRIESHGPLPAHRGGEAILLRCSADDTRFDPPRWRAVTVPLAVLPAETPQD